MSKNKFVLNDTTTITQLNQFFAGLDDATKVRARDLGEGKIELYVRKDTFKQFFTDKLRLGFLVERDYSKAVDRIKKMAAANGSTKSIKYKDEQDSAREEFGRHTHDFSASGLKGHLQHLAQHENNQLTAREALASGIPSRDDLSPELIATLTNSESIKKLESLSIPFFRPQTKKKFHKRLIIFLFIFQENMILTAASTLLPLTTKSPEILQIPGLRRLRRKEKCASHIVRAWKHRY